MSKPVTRQVVLDTETTGINPKEGHKVIEIGCVELVNRRLTRNHFHVYLNPDREIDAGAIEVHGITNEFLRDKPRFADVVDDFMAFTAGAELIIHNAPFDVGFLNHELSLLPRETRTVESNSSVFDTLLTPAKNTLAPVIVWTRCANVTASTTATGNCTARCSMPRFWPTSIY